MTRKVYLGRRHRNVYVNDAILIADAAASAAIRCTAPVIAVSIAIACAPVLFVWSAYEVLSERQREREERFGDGGHA